ncbi:hypothetical protein PGT21_028553 [Puccinia graminis f. sp. tritici]|uniref:CCHC-type domain-containing protein n=1 Tax=Puccinia graminis f. sp. tritici TaxID=56615 RepID=A0A5B0P5L7_PUCGR|nr:hypothetical protein PGT21_028553 [Puccinia graminis f. sp. tritici]
MDYSRIFNQSTGNKSLNPMPPPPIPDPPPLPTGQVLHEPQTTDSPLKILSEITKFLNEALSPKNPARILNENQIQALLDQTIKLKSAMNIESHLEKITEQLERLERRPLTVSPPTPLTWPSATTTNNKKTNPTINKQGKSTPTIPLNAQINEFKKSSLVIRTPPGFVALDSATTTDITTKINKILISIDAKIDSHQIEIDGIARLPSKDLKIYTSSRSNARWLLNNKHKWTDLLCTELKTFPNRYPVILHAIPTNFNPTDTSHLQELGTQNRIDPNLIQSARWLGNPIEKGKKNGSLVLQLLDKDIALKIERSGLFLQNELYQGAHYERSIPQCFNCWKLGHTSQWCKNSPLCHKCHGNHTSSACDLSTPSSSTCCVCISHDKLVSKKAVNTLDEKFSHSPWSDTCPLMKQTIQSRKRRRWKP